MTRFVFLLAPLVLLLSACLAPAAAPPDRLAPSKAALKKLENDLTVAVGDHFAFVRGKVVWRHNQPYWLATLRAKEQGEHILRCGVKYDPIPPWKKRQGPNQGMNWTFRIAIGQAGARRVVQPGGYAVAYPLACVGDQVVVPIRLGLFDKGHRFELTRQRPDERSPFRILQETADRGWAAETGKKAFVLRNGARDVLELVSTYTGGSRTRSGSARLHTLNAVFDAVKPSRFNAEVRLDLVPPKGAKARGAAPWQQAPTRTSFEVVAKGKPLTVFVPRWDRHEYGGKSNTYSGEGANEPVVPLRVGDRLILACGTHATVGVGAVAKHPAAELIKRAFAPPEGVWRDRPRR